jgi:hypothetical protein
MSTSLPTRSHTRWGRAIGIAVGAALLVAVVVLAFMWPAITSTVKDFPIAVAGPSEQVTAFKGALDQNAAGRFDVTEAADRDAAVQSIEEREVYGAVIVGRAPEVLMASANGAVTSQIMSQIAGQLQQQVNAILAQQTAAAQQAGAPAPAPIVVTVTDVVPLASTDERGTGLTAAAFPMVLGGMLGGILVSLLVAGVWRRLVSLTAYAVIAGAGLAAIMQAWFGVLQGDYLANASAIALSLFATGSFIVGMTALIGPPGIAVGAIITLLIGNPISAAAQPLEFLPGPWGAIGQWFVPGASITLLRDLSYFPEADATMPWLVLAAWGVVGVTLMFAGRYRNADVAHDKDAVEQEGPRNSGARIGIEQSAA